MGRQSQHPYHILCRVILINYMQHHSTSAINNSQMSIQKQPQTQFSDFNPRSANSVGFVK